VAREIIGSNSGAPLWANSNLSLEENVLSKWHEQGAMCSESKGSKIRSKIDNKIYEINMIGKHIHKERDTIHPTITTRIFSSSHRTFALNFDQISQITHNSYRKPKLPTNRAYIENMKYINKGVAWATLPSNC
jgi:hypothetical protein